MAMNPNQIVLITGGSRGLGRAIALGAAQAGAQVAVTARSVSELTETVELIRQAGGRAVALPADVTDYRAVVEMVAAAESQLGPIDVLINGAGSFRALGNAAQVDPDEWWREVEINLRGPFLCSHAVLPGMISRRRGRIINIVSAAGLQAIETVSAYGVSKAALIRLSEALAAETRPYGIAVLAVNPGTLRTSMSDYVLTAPQVRERAPMVQQWFEQLFAEGGDTPIEQAVAFVLAVASGRADALSGCYLSVDDDLEALGAEAEAIQSEARLRLRLRA
jgi:NAD(P)-dependent dehydrogenase (short-subunit alcohol dehydrogenase family)